MINETTETFLICLNNGPIQLYILFLFYFSFVLLSQHFHTIRITHWATRTKQNSLQTGQTTQCRLYIQWVKGEAVNVAGFLHIIFSLWKW